MKLRKRKRRKISLLWIPKEEGGKGEDSYTMFGYREKKGREGKGKKGKGR